MLRPEGACERLSGVLPSRVQGRGLSGRLERGLALTVLHVPYSHDSGTHTVIIQRVFMKSFWKSQFPHKTVNLSFIIITGIIPDGSLFQKSISVSTDAAKPDYPLQHSSVAGSTPKEAETQESKNNYSAKKVKWFRGGLVDLCITQL